MNIVLLFCSVYKPSLPDITINMIRLLYQVILK